MDAEHAGRILAAMITGPLYSMEYGEKNLKPLKEGGYSFPEIKVKKAHSPEQWDRIKESVQAFETSKKEWEAINKVYQNAVKERQSIINAVRDAISDARDNNYSREQLRSEFARYLVLAEDNRHIALNFLEKTKGSTLDQFPELREEFCPLEVTA